MPFRLAETKVPFLPCRPAHVEGYDSALAVESQQQVEHSLIGGRRHSGTGIASAFEDLRNLEEQMNQMSMSLTVRQTTVYGLTPEQEHEGTLLRAAFGGSAVSASHLPDYCRENGLEIPLPESTKIPVDARVFVLYQGNEPASPTYARCPPWLRKQNASPEKVFTASIPSLDTTTEEEGPNSAGCSASSRTTKTWLCCSSWRWAAETGFCLCGTSALCQDNANALLR
jgi:hypothetical protein